MRSRISLFFSAILLMLGLLSLAQPAAAAPAEPYQTTDDCVQVGTGEICINGHYMVQENESASGVIKVTINGTSTETFTGNGALIHTYDLNVSRNAYLQGW